jgi:hypothetical protein
MGTNFNPNKSKLTHLLPVLISYSIDLNPCHNLDKNKSNIGVKKRIRKNSYKARRGTVVPVVEMRKIVGKKKQQQLAKALKHVSS